MYVFYLVTGCQTNQTKKSEFPQAIRGREKGDRPMKSKLIQKYDDREQRHKHYPVETPLLEMQLVYYSRV